MTRIGDLLATGQTVSFEFFPPKTDAGWRRLRGTVSELEPLRPSFVSVTHGADGSTRDGTRRVVLDLLAQTDLSPMPHLTCISQRRADLHDTLVGYGDAGVENVLALHGDQPRDHADAPGGELRRARELVELARQAGDFSDGVATHPEGHPKAPNPVEDRRHQAEKLRAADFGITQFFFDVAAYLRLVDDLAALGVDKPIVAGVIPITDVAQVERFARLSGAAFPADLAERFQTVADRTDEVRLIGVEVATELCRHLLDAGAPGLHFYTLNRAEATRAVLAGLGLSDKTASTERAAPTKRPTATTRRTTW